MAQQTVETLRETGTVCGSTVREIGKRGSVQQANAARGGGERAVESFEYPACSTAPPVPAWDGWVEAEEDEDAAGADHAAGRAAGAIDEEQLAQEIRRAFERGREEGRRAEREALAPTAAAEAERRRRQAAELIANLARERDRYFHAVEQEAVRLALAVAARILRREAQMDPLLLTGAVRVALGQLAANSEVRLRVPAKEADLWQETIALLPNVTVKPAVVADEGMRLGECVIESKVGSVDLGIRAQLSEIERGFFDRAGTQGAAQRQTAASPAQELAPVEART